MKNFFLISLFFSLSFGVEAQQKVRIDTLVECYPGKMYHFTEENGFLFVAPVGGGGERVKIKTTYEIRGYHPFMVKDPKTKNGIVILYLYSGSNVLTSEYNIINSGVSVPIPIDP